MLHTVAGVRPGRREHANFSANGDLAVRDIAREAVDAGAPLPPRYRRLLWLWVTLGIPAFIALIVVFYLMVAKPA